MDGHSEQDKGGQSPVVLSAARQRQLAREARLKAGAATRLAKITGEPVPDAQAALKTSKHDRTVTTEETDRQDVPKPAKAQHGSMKVALHSDDPEEVDLAALERPFAGRAPQNDMAMFDPFGPNALPGFSPFGDGPSPFAMNSMMAGIQMPSADPMQSTQATAQQHQAKRAGASALLPILRISCVLLLTFYAILLWEPHGSFHRPLLSLWQPRTILGELSDWRRKWASLNYDPGLSLGPLRTANPASNTFSPASIPFLQAFVAIEAVFLIPSLLSWNSVHSLPTNMFTPFLSFVPQPYLFYVTSAFKYWYALQDVLTDISIVLVLLGLNASLAQWSCEKVWGRGGWHLA